MRHRIRSCIRKIYMGKNKNKNKTPTTTVGEGRGATNWNCRNLISNQSFLILSGAKDISKVRSVVVPDLSYQSTCTWNSLSADPHFFVGFPCKVLWGSGFARLLLWERGFTGCCCHIMRFVCYLLRISCGAFTKCFLVLLRILCGVLWPVFSVLLRILCGVLWPVLRILCGVLWPVSSVLLRILCGVLWPVSSVLLRILCGVLWPVFSVLLKFICGVYVVFVLLRILCHVSASCIFWVTEHSLWHFCNMFLCYWGIFVVFCPMCFFV